MQEQITYFSSETEADKRRAVVSAFNDFYIFVYNSSIETGHLGYLRMLREGVKKVTGRDFVNPCCAIPSDYRGDGSFEMAWETQDKRKFSRREGIPLDGLVQFLGKRFYWTLMENSRNFHEPDPRLFEERVRLEAYLDWSKNGKSDPVLNFDFASVKLRSRKELVIPVLHYSRFS